jgi:hypothetical protein
MQHAKSRVSYACWHDVARCSDHVQLCCYVQVQVASGPVTSTFSRASTLQATGSVSMQPPLEQDTLPTGWCLVLGKQVAQAQDTLTQPLTPRGREAPLQNLDTSETSAPLVT